MNIFLRWLFYNIIVRFVVLIVIGLNVRHARLLPKQGPAIIIANHNSHLDTLVLMTLLPNKLLAITHPVAATDYFLKNKLLAWFATKIIGIIPIERNHKNRKSDLLEPCHQALNNSKIIILFPEGTRGEPEQLSEFKSGIAHLAKAHPTVPIIPIFLHGLGKALPKGKKLIVPFFCDVFIGESFTYLGDKELTMQKITDVFTQLAIQCPII